MVPLPDASKVTQRVGRYEVVGQLTTGGMAEILLGRAAGPQGFARAVVIKRILPHLARREDFRSMFLDEARIVAGIHHDNVVHVHELGEEGDELFLVMEYLEGESAAGLSRRLLRRRETLDAPLAAYIVAQACAGLHAAHELEDVEGQPLGLVHRDVSPQNIFVTYNGGVKVLDFGIAHAAGRMAETEAGQIKGKFAYMSPEQCRGKTLDRRSDIFTLGTVLYELSTARRLFHRDNELRTMHAVCLDAIVAPSAIVAGYPPELERVCLRALARSRSERYTTAAEMRAELNSVVQALADARETLAALMQRLFADRIAEKSEMLRIVRAGGAPARLTAAETDHAVVLPTVEAAMDGATTETNSELLSDGKAPRRRRLRLALAAGALLSIVAVLSWVAAGPRSLAPALPAITPPAASVVVRVETEPAGARVRIAGRHVGHSPVDVTLAQGSDALAVDVALPGYAPLRDKVTPDVSQRLRLTLAAEPHPSAPPSASAAPSRPPRRSAPAAPASSAGRKGIYKL